MAFRRVGFLNVDEMTMEILAFLRPPDSFDINLIRRRDDDNRNTNTRPHPFSYFGYLLFGDIKFYVTFF